MKKEIRIEPWSRSVAVTVNTVVPGPWFSNTWVWNSEDWNTGASSFTSITCTQSTWEVDSWGIPWSSATMVRLKTSCSSRSKGLRTDKEPVKKKQKNDGNSVSEDLKTSVSGEGVFLFRLVLWTYHSEYLWLAVVSPQGSVKTTTTKHFQIRFMRLLFHTEQNKS